MILAATLLPTRMVTRALYCYLPRGGTQQNCATQGGDQHHMARKRGGRKPGLGWQHDQQRAKLIRQHVDGVPCWWCGKPMYVDKTLNHDGLPLAADHVLARTNGGRHAERLLHYSCNSARGDGSKDHMRPTAPASRPAFRW